MSAVRIQSNDAAELAFFDAGRTATDIVTYQVTRRSDGFRYDFNDSTWKASGWTTPTAPMAFVFNGLWTATFAASNFSDVLDFLIDNTTTGNEVHEQYILGGYADDIDQGLVAMEADLASLIQARVLVATILEELKITVQAPSPTPLPNARVRLTTLAGAYIGSAVTDVNGEAIFDVAPGTYLAYFYERSTTFTNPQTIVVADTSSAAASLSEVFAVSTFQGDVAIIRGFNFDLTPGSNTVLFTTAAATTSAATVLGVSPDRRILACRMPTNLGNLASSNVTVNNGVGVSNQLAFALTQPPSVTAVTAGAGGTLDLVGLRFGTDLTQNQILYTVVSGDTGSIGNKRHGANTLTNTVINVDLPAYSSATSLTVTVHRRGVPSATFAYVVP